MRAVCLFAAALLLAGCQRGRAPHPSGAAARTEGGDRGASAQFVNVAEACGIHWRHVSGGSGRFYFPETMGSGGAFLDYDGDGRLDLFLVNSTRLPGFTGKGPFYSALYHQRPDGTFEDRTKAAGLAVECYGMGVAVGDYDNDGWPDLYVTSFGPSQLLHNQGDGTFRDVTERAGAGSARWSASAAFVDFDRDGWLDLYVADYVDYTLTTDRACPLPGGRRDYCGPLTYHPLPHRLLRNRGDGTFEDVSEASRIRTALGNGLGVVAADFDGDGWPDIYVANDQTENFLWMNQRDGTFRNTALEAGAALSGDGSPEGSMGVDAGDFDGDGDEDLFFTNLTGQKNTLYVNDGHAGFTDQSLPSGLGRLNQWGTGFGAGFVDYDDDGWLDVLLVNGTVLGIDAQLKSGDALPYKQPGQLFRNLGSGRFREVSEGSGALLVPAVSRAAAFGDVDNDGDVDVLVTQIDGPARLLVNQVGAKQHWLGVRLLAGKRDALGARAVLRRSDGPALVRRAHSDGSYCSANDPRVLFGLGASASGGVLEVSWPDGRRERFRDVLAGRYTTLSEGRGEAMP
jgi:hypothetical protein